ncbi:DUF5916 domain-containing protein [Thalassotalea sp. PLHSN55]|uniref:carbohydrate binding family 9 domain-containing protein n=1 Tax=Thalassotalea sp. PLHSN55 TaxID=3435888 RepID=UPI003F86410C
MSILRTKFFVFCALLWAFSNSTFASSFAPSSAPYNIPTSSLSANIDGSLDDEIWKNALTISLDLVNSPWDNQPAPVKTTAKIIENSQFLYIAFIAKDPQPEKIIAALADRDSRWGDDLVGIKLDTANNRRLNYSFLVNPFGVQHDQIYNEMTGNSNDAWDGIWQSYGKLTADGYQVELAIPFHILNFEPSNENKTWAFELIRLYPRDTNLRISHVPLDRDNACWLCQYPEISGFENAQAGKNITLTPTVVAAKNQTRDVYASDDDWHDNDDIEAGLDLRWGISSDTLLNLTLNPDFSTVESDAGQLSVNKTFSLFYDEKRSFFLENSDYFTSNFDLVYTRNIADPDYGVKLTGTKNQHTYGFFVTNDTETNFILPGNTASRLISLDEESHSSAFKYRYDFTDDFSVGVINTIRASENYHNIVTGLDTKYRFDQSNSILAQVVSANTEMPEGYQNNNNESFTDSAIKLDLVHQSEYWDISAHHQQIGKNFRADLGFMPKANYRQDKLKARRTFYGDVDSWWSDANIQAQAYIEHDEDGKLLEKTQIVSTGIHGPMLSYAELKWTHADKLGLEQDYFSENEVEMYFFIQPVNNFYNETSIITGKRIDYINNRLGDFNEIWNHVLVNLTDHLELDISYTYSELDNQGENIYQEQIADVRLSYQFDVRSYIKLNMVYTDIEFNPLQNQRLFSLSDSSEHNKALSTQLIYAYKLNPQTLFFLGYSDNSLQDNQLKTLTQQERTFFTKVSYAWMPN